MKLERPLFLIGYRGTGKTTVARLLSARLDCPWLDADAVLEERVGQTIHAIFAAEGEAGFREREAALLRELAAGPPRVIAAGGGVVVRPENHPWLRRGAVVWLTAPPAVLWQRLQADPLTTARRPDLAQGGLAEIETLLAARTPLYAALADFTVEAATAAPEAVAEQIEAWLRRR